MANKRVERLLNEPKDYQWGELEALLQSLGYRVQNGKGSRRRFIDDQKQKISLHEPHPDKTLKAYMIKQVIEKLKDHNKI